MNKGRLEAFSDGVLAVVITIMVLEIKAPHGVDFNALRPLFPILTSYVLSFIFIGIYWNNHHHLFQAVQKVNGGILWANLHLLFWLSLIPFLTAWMGENPLASVPVAFYGIALLFAGVAFAILSKALVAHQGKNSVLEKAIHHDTKSKISIVLYTIAVPLAFINPRYSYVLYMTVVLMWLVPDRRIEKTLVSSN
jgi:uncharacterized membrane protein